AHGAAPRDGARVGGWVEGERGPPAGVVADRRAHILPPWQRRPAPPPESPTLSGDRDATPPSPGRREPRRWNRAAGPPARDAAVERPAAGGPGQPPPPHPPGHPRLPVGGAAPGRPPARPPPRPHR